MRRSSGFSLVELVVAMALTLTLVATVFSLTQSSRGMSAAQGEIADQQQRTRVAVDAITHHLSMTGAGANLAGHAGPLNKTIPAVLPFRRGMVGGDPPGAFKTNSITLIYVPVTAAQTILTADAAAGSQTLQVARVPFCAAGTNLCSFAAGTTILLFDVTGAFQILTVATVAEEVCQLLTSTPTSTLYQAGTPVVEVSVHAYALKTDPTTRVQQLVHYDGTENADLPVTRSCRCADVRLRRSCNAAGGWSVAAQPGQ